MVLAGRIRPGPQMQASEMDENVSNAPDNRYNTVPADIVLDKSKLALTHVESK